MKSVERHPLTEPAAEVFVGIDVSKAALDVALRPSGAAWRAANDEAGIADVVGRLQMAGPRLIVLEATGGLERLVVSALALAGLPVAVVNPRQVRDFAKATGQLAKTDALDAAVLAHFAQAIRPAPRPLPDAQSQALAALVERWPPCGRMSRPTWPGSSRPSKTSTGRWISSCTPAPSEVAPVWWVFCVFGDGGVPRFSGAEVPAASKGATRQWCGTALVV